MPSSTENYLDVARRFLFERFPAGKIYLMKMRVGDVTDFLLHDSSNRGRRSSTARKKAELEYSVYEREPGSSLLQTKPIHRGINLIQKPFDLKELLSFVKAAVNSPTVVVETEKCFIKADCLNDSVLI
jgi:hypothetical protein